jgi:hypothetical protein
MMNHIAVILRGHFRTWGYVHPAVFDFYDKIAHNVDYYISTWRHPDTGFQHIEDTFTNFNKNLVKILPVEIDALNFTSFKGVSYLAYNLIPYMRQRHKEVNYDFVFNTRPDIIYRIKPGHQVPKLNSNTWYTTDYGVWDDNDGNHRIGVEDHLFAGAYDINTTMSMRHTYHDVIGCHNSILQYARDENIHTAAMYWMEAHIVRPNAFELIPDPMTYFDNDYGSLHMNWMNLPKEDKLNMLQKYNIREHDYITNSILAKL